MAKEAFDKNWEKPLFKGVLLKRSSTLSIANASTNTITWQSAVYDTNGFWSSTTNPARITVKPGIKWVRLFGSVYISNSDTNNFNVNILKSGTSTVATTTTTAASGGIVAQCTTPPLEVVEGDFFILTAQQNSGAARNVPDDSRTRFGMEVIS